MACTQQHWQTLAASSKYAFHRTDVDLAKDILKKGLQPWDKLGEPQQDEEFCPRPGHVYFGLDEQSLIETHLTNIAHSEAGDISTEYCVFRIPLSRLKPALVNPDEDAYWHHECNGPAHSLCGHEPIPPFSYPELEISEYSSFGDWAQGIDLGRNPEHTACGIDKTKTFAYQEPVPSKHLKLLECYVKRSKAGTLHWQVRPAKELLDWI